MSSPDDESGAMRELLQQMLALFELIDGEVVDD